MKKIDSIDELSQMINSRFSKEYLRNSLKNIKTYEASLDEIYVHITNDDLFIFNKRSDFYLMDAIMKKSSPHSLSIDEDIVVEYVYRNNIGEFDDIIKELGFQVISTRVKMMAKDFKGKENLVLLKPSEAELILNEIKSNFNHYYGCIPSYSEVEEKINNNEFLGIFQENNLVGLIEISKSGKKVSIDHILIVDAYKGKGFSKILLDGLFNYANDNDYNTIELFVNPENESALKAYESMGFEGANIESIIYRRKKNEG